VNRATFAATAVLVASLSSSPAAADTDLACDGVITSLPAVIAGGGVHCLRANVATPIASGVAITVTGRATVLDCNGFAITGQAGSATQATGIRVDGELAVIRNCLVRGFQIGIDANTPTDAYTTIEDNLLTGNTVTGIEGGSIVRGNRVLDTGGSTAANYFARPLVYGIYLAGGLVIEDNVVDGVHAVSGSGRRAYGLYAYWSQGRIIGNRVRRVDEFSSALAYGMMLSTGRPRVEGNHVGDVDVGYYCSVRALVFGNVASGTGTAYSMPGVACIEHDNIAY
jgi:hypothetical protein